MKFLCAIFVLATATSASAVTLEFTFYQTNLQNPNGTPISNIANASVFATTSIDVDDSEIGPNAFIPFNSTAVSDFSISYVDQFGEKLTFNTGNDATNFFPIPGAAPGLGGTAGQELGLIFDSSGNFDRIDAPFFTFSNGYVIYDDEFPQGGAAPHPYFEIHDDDDLDFGFFKEDTLVEVFINGALLNSIPYDEGDFVSPELFAQNLEAFSFGGIADVVVTGGDIAVFTNFWGATNHRDYTGVLPFQGYVTARSIETSSPVAPVPLPAGMPLLLAGLAVLGVVARRRTLTAS